MNSKSIFFSIFLGLTVISCDPSILINVNLGSSLADQNYSIIDYDFVLAQANEADNLHFEFVINNELAPSTPITFFDESGNTIAVKEAGSASNLISPNIELTGERSFAYSINLDGLRSSSLIKEVTIGN